jgi:DNA-binding GntR family transcriptional regulator
MSPEDADRMSEPASIFARPIVASERTGNLIAHEIRRAILEGRVQPGDVLREEQLARELGTSRTPVREALIELRNEGLVEAQATRRAVVREYDAAELYDIYGLRAALEAHAARLAAQRATPDTVRELAASIDRFHELAGSSSDEVNELVTENLAFHAVIAEATGVPRLQKMIDQVMVIPKRYRAYAAYVPEHRATVEQHHGGIADAIGRGDADAAGALMDEHVRWTGDIAVAAQQRR